MPKVGKKGRQKELPKTENTQMSRAKSLESVYGFSVANSKIWENRLGVAETSRNEHRLCAKRLAAENEELNSLMIRNEKDTIEVIGYLKDKLREQEKSIKDEQEQARVLKRANIQEIEIVVGDFTKQINYLGEKLKEKNHDISVLKDELKFAKEFRRNRREMLTEIAELKKTVELANRIHKMEFGKLEKRFLQEKCQLEKESKLRLDELAEKTHKEAIYNLDETAKSVFKDNIRLKEALNIEMKENQLLKKSKDALFAENSKLNADKEINDISIKSKISRAKHERQKISTYKDKVEVLENSLTHIVKEFDAEKSILASHSNTEILSVKDELDRLQRILELKTREMVKVKKLAKTILDQRTEVETFFMEALDHVKAEIAKDNSTSKQARACESMTSLDEPEALYNLHRMRGRIDISDLSWLQKEKVLRLLFAKMNGYARYTKVKVQSAPTFRKLPFVHQTSLSEIDKTKDKSTFITET